MNNKIVKVNSTLGSKKSPKKSKSTSGKKRIIPAYDIMERSRDTKSLISFMILIPIAIVILIIVIIIFVITEINNKPHNFEGDTQLNSENVLYISPENRKKLFTIASQNFPLDNNYKVDLIDDNGIQYDSILKEPLRELIDSAKDDGVSIKITDGYISSDEQNKLFQAEVERLIKENGYSRVKAENEAEKSVPRGGESDRQTGLSVVFSSKGKFTESDEYSWLLMNSHKYGFVQRYPETKEDETKVKFDPSLFRYVGKENASKILMLDMSLDEYISYVNSR